MPMDMPPVALQQTKPSMSMAIAANAPIIQAQLLRANISNLLRQSNIEEAVSRFATFASIAGPSQQQMDKAILLKIKEIAEDCFAKIYKDNLAEDLKKILDDTIKKVRE
jgi:hypothetical protein